MSEYEITQWRKRLERKGWLGLSRSSPPIDRLVEYHVVWQGWLISGRCVLGKEIKDDWWKPGTPQYLLSRKHGISDGVWRLAKDQRAEVGQVRRRWWGAPSLAPTQFRYSYFVETSFLRLSHLYTIVL